MSILKQLCALFLFVVCTFLSFANDGSYLSRGGIIYPLNETKISMDKEILSFTVKDRKCYVNIHFEFNNPEKEDRKFLVGFQAPRSAGDFSWTESRHPQIYDFVVVNQGKQLESQLKFADCEDCALTDTSTIAEEGEGGIFVYLFEMTFKPGLNEVDHSYTFDASSSVSISQMYNYILKTGSKWAGGTIKDLTVNITMPENAYFYVTDIFGEDASWTVKGKGKACDGKFDLWDNSCRMVRTIDGSLEIRTKDFHPTDNLEFGIVSDHTFLFRDPSNWENNDRIKYALTYLTLDIGYLEEKPLSKSELRIMRNSFYAQEGYVFKDQKLQSYFSKFEWYYPNPELKINEIQLKPEIQSFIDEIIKLEKK